MLDTSARHSLKPGGGGVHGVTGLRLGRDHREAGKRVNGCK